MKTRTRDSLILVLVLLLTVSVFLVNEYVLPGVILPGPPYFIWILIAAYFLSPRSTAGVAVFATALKLAADLTQEAPAWLLTSYFTAMVLVGLASTVLAGKMRQEAALSADRERSRAEAVRQAAALETIVESIADALFVCDSQGKIGLVNHAGLALVGEEKAEAVGTLSDYLKTLQLRYLDGRPVPLDDLPIIRALHGEVSSGREEIAIHPKTHRRIDLLISAAPLRDHAGRVIGGVEVAADISRVRELVEKAQRHAVELDAVNKELEAFTFSVSHDLRPPLTRIDGFSKMLLEGYSDKLDERGKEYLQRVRKGSKMMSQLIDDLLKLSSVTRSDLRRDTVDLSEMAESIATELQNEQPERQVEFAISPGAVAQGDPGLLQVALGNLLGNAWKFTSKSVRARIEFGVTQSDGKQVYYVRDDGAGFDTTCAERLFVPFPAPAQ